MVSPGPPDSPESPDAPEAGDSEGSPPRAPGGEDEDRDAPPAAEDTAQASARSEVVSKDELPSGAVAAGGDAAEDRPPKPPGTDPERASVVSGPSDERPDLADLREELNDQFESIRVLEPGQYELNLMELYDREEYIIALQEDGKYTIQVPDRWKDG